MWWWEGWGVGGKFKLRGWVASWVGGRKPRGCDVTTSNLTSVSKFFLYPAFSCGRLWLHRIHMMTWRGLRLMIPTLCSMMRLLLVLWHQRCSNEQSWKEGLHVETTAAIWKEGLPHEARASNQQTKEDEGIILNLASTWPPLRGAQGERARAQKPASAHHHEQLQVTGVNTIWQRCGNMCKLTCLICCLCEVVHKYNK